MTQHHEKLSAIVDGENFTDDIVDQLKSDTALSDTWQRYNLIGDVMRNEVPDQIHLNFADQVAQALEQEQEIVAPVVERKWRDSFIGIKDNVVALAQQSGQFAIAATVTAAVIFGVQQYNVPMQHNETGINAPILPVSINAGVSPVSLESTRTVSKQELLQQRQRVNAYILDHQQQLRLQAAKKQQVEQQNEEKETNQTPETP